MKASPLFFLGRSAMLVAVGLCLMNGCRRESDSDRQTRLVGRWRYSGSEGIKTEGSSEMTFTVTAAGDYISRVTRPDTHSVEGTAKIENGILIITATKRDGSSVNPPLVDRQTIIQFDDTELVTRSEGSTVKNHFKKIQAPAESEDGGGRI